MASKEYQLIALDMDGTVLNDRKQLTANVEAAIHDALAAGKEVVFCTGRSYAEMRQVLKSFPDMHYLLGESGALLYDVRHERVLSHVTVDPSFVEKMRPHVENRDICPYLFSNGESYLHPDQADRLAYYEMPAYANTIPKVAGRVDNIYEEAQSGRLPAEKFCLFHHSVEDRDTTWKLLGHLLDEVEAVDSEISSLEITAKGVSKGYGLKRLSELTGIRTEEMIMVGDADNDLEGIRAVGLGIAMGNANARVKAAAKVAVRDNNHDGVAQAIREYLLG